MRVNNVKSDPGFSFLELMVVMILLGLITVLAVPNLNEALANYKLEAAAREFVTQVRYVRSRAINGESTSVGLLYGDTKYIIRKQTTAEQVFQLPPGIRFDNSLIRELYFDLQGDLSKGATTIYLKDQRNRQVEITITPATGRVKIK